MNRASSSPLVSVASGVYRRAAPVVSRCPGLVFLLIVTTLAIKVALLTVSLDEAARVAEVRASSGGAAAAGPLPLGRVREIATDAGLITPAPLLWVLQRDWLRDLIAMQAVVVLASLAPAVGIWGERKIAARFQSRLGPTRVGGWHGWAQSVADGVKMLSKEDLVPRGADPLLFRLAPYLVVAPAVAAFLAVPMSLQWVVRDLDAAAVLVLGVLAFEIVGVLLAGWASNSKWSLFGAMRIALQMIAYEVPLALALMVPVLLAESLRLTSIAMAQYGGWQNWFIFDSPFALVAFVVFFLAALAAAKRAPFDLPEAESELVAGFHTEYSGLRWSLFFLAEYTVMLLTAALAVVLFLGGWDAPWALTALRTPPHETGATQRLIDVLLLSGPHWFLLKSALLVYVQMWLRWTLPRPRIDQMVHVGVKVLVPVSLVAVVGAAGWELLRAASPAFAVVAHGVSMALAVGGVLLALGMLLVAMYGRRHGAALVGRMAATRVTAGG